MAILTPRLQIPKPEGNEYVSREKFNEIYDKIDAKAATVEEVNNISTQMTELATKQELADGLVTKQDTLPIENRRKITFGTEEPTPESMMEGDIYMQYE